MSVFSSEYFLTSVSCHDIIRSYGLYARWVWPPGFPPAMLFYRCSLDLLSFFQCLISEVTWPIVTKLCHISDGNLDYEIWSEIWGPLLPRIWWPKNFGDFVTWSRISLERIKISSVGKRHCKLRILPHSETNLIWCTLVHKEQSSDPSNGRPSVWALPCI